MNRKDPFITGQSYHVYNRGVDKRNVFNSTKDYERFLSILDAFNTLKPANNTTRSSQRKKELDDSKLIEMHDYCLMPNHYHLVVEQLTDNGVSKFLQKVMTGYTMYFNKKNERSGVVFQGRTKSKLVFTDEYRLWLKNYLALNPLDLCEPGWKTNGIKNETNALKFLKEYKWKKEFNYSDKEIKSFIKDLKEGNFLPF
jgi:putative transposase